MEKALVPISFVPISFASDIDEIQRRPSLSDLKAHTDICREIVHQINITVTTKFESYFFLKGDQDGVHGAALSSQNNSVRKRDWPKIAQYAL